MVCNEKTVRALTMRHLLHQSISPDAFDFKVGYRVEEPKIESWACRTELDELELI